MPDHENTEKNIRACSQIICVYEAQTKCQLLIRLGRNRKKETLEKVRQDGEGMEGQGTQRGNPSTTSYGTVSELQTAGIRQANEKSSPDV